MIGFNLFPFMVTQATKGTNQSNVYDYELNLFIAMASGLRPRSIMDLTVDKSLKID